MKKITDEQKVYSLSRSHVHNEAGSTLSQKNIRNVLAVITGGGGAISSLFTGLAFFQYKQLTSAPFSPYSSASEVRILPANNPQADYVNDAIENQKPSDQHISQVYTLNTQGVFTTSPVSLPPSLQKPLDITKLNSEVQTSIDQHTSTYLDTAQLAGGSAAALIIASVCFTMASRGLSKKIDRLYQDNKPAPRAYGPGDYAAV